jgi:hypothetical protein
VTDRFHKVDGLGDSAMILSRFNRRTLEVW